MKGLSMNGADQAGTQQALVPECPAILLEAWGRDQKLDLCWENQDWAQNIRHSFMLISKY